MPTLSKQTHMGDTRRILVERVAVKNLRRIASCPAAEWRPASSVSLRTIITDILLCTDEQRNEGKLLSLWREESTDYRGRRYSGPSELHKQPPELKRVRNRGANPGCIGRSLFGYPGFIRNLARSGLQDLYILDIVNCHVQLLHRRHPSLQHLAY